MRIAFCGLGNMGRPMAARILEAGHELSVWNRTPERSEPFAGRGARVAATPAEAALDAEVVITMLTDADAVEAVLFGPGGATSGLPPGAVVVEMSTIGPGAIRSISERLPRGIRLVDAPVKGGPARAERGELKILVGGDPGDVARVMPVLAAMGTPAPLGPLGTGAAAKVLNNYVVVTLVSVLGEAMALADSLQLDESLALGVLRGTPLGATVERQWKRATKEAAPSFRMALATKDLALAVDALGASGRRPVLGEAALDRLRQALEEGMGDLDQATVVRRIRTAP